MKPRLLDLFCGAGGCSKGYADAGFDVVGVDLRPQPNYPYPFVQADALDVLGDLVDGRSKLWPTCEAPHLPVATLSLRDFAAIHASPPCQAYSRLKAMHPGKRDEYPMLIDAVRELLIATGLPYVIENVEDAPLAVQGQLDGHTWGITLCGSMFGLGVERGHLRRHRLFESNFAIPQPTCVHRGPAVGVYGHGGHTGKHRMLYAKEAAEAMGIDWMTRDEMTQAIPPAYTEHIGRYLLVEVDALSERVA